MYYFFSVFLILFFLPFNALSQSACPDGPSNRYKNLTIENKGSGNIDAQAYSQAAMYEIGVCACSSGELLPQADVQGLKIRAEAAKAEAQRLKSGLTFRSWPAQCKFRSGDGASPGVEGGLSEKEKRIQQSRQQYESYLKAQRFVDEAEARAKELVREVEQFSRLQDSDDPFQIMNEYRNNLSQIEGIQSELRQEVNRSNVETGIQIIEDYQSGNYSGSVYSTLGLLGGAFENRQAKKEIEAKKRALMEQQESMLRNAADRLVRVNEEAKYSWLESAELALEKDREGYFLAMALNHNQYINHILQNFSTANTYWAENPSSPIVTPDFSPQNDSPTAEEIATAARRKADLYQKYKIEELGRGAVRFASILVNEDPDNIEYHLLLAEVSSEYDMNQSLLSYLTVLELNPDYELGIGFLELQQNYLERVKVSFEQIDINLEGQKQNFDDLGNSYEWNMMFGVHDKFITSMISNNMHNILLSHDLDEIPNPISPLEFVFTTLNPITKVLFYLDKLPESEKIEHLNSIMEFLVLNNLVFESTNQGVSTFKEIGRINRLSKYGTIDELEINIYRLLTIAMETEAFYEYYQLIKYLEPSSENIPAYSETTFLPLYLEFFRNPSELGQIINSIENEERRIDFLKSLVSYSNNSRDQTLTFESISYTSEELKKIVLENTNVKERNYNPEAEEVYVELVKDKLIKTVDENISTIIIETLATLNSNDTSVKRILGTDTFEKQLQESFFNRVVNYQKRDHYTRENHSDIEKASLMIKHNLITLSDDLLPPFNLSQMSNSTITNQDFSCLLCIKKLDTSDYLELMLQHFTKLYENDASADPQQQFYNQEHLNMLTRALNNFRETGVPIYREKGPYTPQYVYNKKDLEIAYNTLADSLNLPIVNSSIGSITKPIDPRIESYAHIALLTRNLPLFEALDQNYTLHNVYNFAGFSVLDYLNQLVTEDIRFLEFVAVSSFRNDFDWGQKIENKSFSTIIKEEKRTELFEFLKREKLIR